MEFLKIFCSFCAKKCKKLIILNVRGTCDDQIKEIASMLQIFNGFELPKSNEIPNNICLSCLDDLKSCHAFYLKFKEAEKVFQCVSIERKTVGTKLPLLMPKLSESTTRAQIPAKPKRRYPCQEPNCTKLFSSSRTLAVHQKAQHNHPNVCRFCGHFFLNAPMLESHTKAIHPDSTFECKTCHRSFISRNLLFKHLKIQHNTNDWTYFCTECKDLPSSRFFNMAELKQHINSIHSKELGQNTPAEIINANADLETEMTEEFLDDMDEEFLDEFSFCWDDLSLPPFDEELDSQLLPDPGTESNQYRRFKCPRCDQTFTTQQTLKQHLAHHHDEFVLICNICGSPFNRATNLKQHRNLHVMERTAQFAETKIRYGTSVPQFCYLCDKTFKTLPGLKYHMKTHAGLKPFTCMYCEKRFTADINLNAHIRVVHADIKAHVCSLCDRRFATIDHLKKHVMSGHQKERNHLCSTCGKGFSQSSHLKQHMFIHTPDVKPYCCDSCGQGFVKRIELNRHIEKMHGEGVVGSETA